MHMHTSIRQVDEERTNEQASECKTSRKNKNQVFDSFDSVRSVVWMKSQQKRKISLKKYLLCVQLVWILCPLFTFIIVDINNFRWSLFYFFFFLDKRCGCGHCIVFASSVDLWQTHLFVSKYIKIININKRERKRERKGKRGRRQRDMVCDERYVKI